MSGRALVVGVTGISGGNVADRLLADGWDVLGLSRRPSGLDQRITPAAFMDAAVAALPRESVQQNSQLIVGYMRDAYWRFISCLI